MHRSYMFATLERESGRGEKRVRAPAVATCPRRGVQPEARPVRRLVPRRARGSRRPRARASRSTCAPGASSSITASSPPRVPSRGSATSAGVPAGPDDVDTIAERIDATGAGLGRHDDNVGYGPSHRYRGPGGQTHEVFWEVDRWQAPPELATAYPGHAQRYTGAGSPRAISTTTIATPNVPAEAAFHRDHLGMTWTDYTSPRRRPSSSCSAP